MIRNSILMGFRQIKKHLGYVSFNIAGLAIGLSAAIIIFLYVRDELQFDNLHPHADITYRIGGNFISPNGFENSFPGGPAGWDNYLVDTYPSVEKNTSFTFFGMPTTFRYAPTNKIVMTENLIWAEPNIMDLIYFPAVEGNPDTWLERTNAVLLSESEAKKIFGEEDPMEKVISVSHMFATDSTDVSLVVSGIYKDLPANVHIRPDYVINFNTLRPFTPNFDEHHRWSPQLNIFAQTFFTCTDPNDIETIKEDLQAKMDGAIEQNNLDFKYGVIIRNMREVHFDTGLDWSVAIKSSDPNTIKILAAIGIMILVMACVNYVNMTTARSSKRAKEVGLRKTFGGVRTQLFAQFMAESLITVGIAIFISIVLVAIAIPFFNDLADKTFGFLDLLNGEVLLAILAVLIITTVGAGSYPALYLSSFEPVVVLKEKAHNSGSANLMRKILTVFQFTLSLMLLIGTVIVVQQMNLMTSSKLNEAGDQILSIRYGGFSGPATVDRYQVFKREVTQNPRVQAVTLANHLPRLDYFGPTNMLFKLPSFREEPLSWNWLEGDYDFPKTFDMELIAGRYFETGNTADSSSYLVNEAVLKNLDLTPDQIIGETILIPQNLSFVGETSFADAQVGKVIGVVKDFAYKSMYNQIEPLVICPTPSNFDRIIHVKMSSGDFPSTIAYLERTWAELYPDYGFDYWFVDDEFSRMYERESRMTNLSQVFATLALALTIFGLYGLAAFISQQRRKEIGIRKVLGAGTGQILWVLILFFLKLIGIAALIAIPAAILFVNQWLQSFVYRVDISVWIVGGSVLGLSLVTVVTILYETLKAATVNPSQTLRYE